MYNQSKKTRKYCIVPCCTSTSTKTPEKIFIRLPGEQKRRSLWLSAIHRHPADFSTKTCAFICEDHFNLEYDMLNYEEYKSGIGKVRMRSDIIPHIFSEEWRRQSLIEPVESNTPKRRTSKSYKTRFTANEISYLQYDNDIDINTGDFDDIDLLTCYDEVEYVYVKPDNIIIEETIDKTIDKTNDVPNVSDLDEKVRSIIEQQREQIKQEKLNNDTETDEQVVDYSNETYTNCKNNSTEQYNTTTTCQTETTTDYIYTGNENFTTNDTTTTTTTTTEYNNSIKNEYYNQHDLINTTNVQNYFPIQVDQQQQQQQQQSNINSGFPNNYINNTSQNVPQYTTPSALDYNNQTTIKTEYNNYENNCYQQNRYYSNNISQNNYQGGYGYNNNQTVYPNYFQQPNTIPLIDKRQEYWSNQYQNYGLNNYQQQAGVSSNPYQIQNTNYNVSYMDDVNRVNHMQWFKCDVCNQSFMGKYALYRHFKMHTEEQRQQQQQQQQQNYCCRYCWKTFKESGSLFVHERNFHMDMNPYRCNVCTRTFLYNSNLQYHLLTHRNY